MPAKAHKLSKKNVLESQIIGIWGDRLAQEPLSFSLRLWLWYWFVAESLIFPYTIPYYTNGILFLFLHLRWVCVFAKKEFIPVTHETKWDEKHSIRLPLSTTSFPVPFRRETGFTITTSGRWRVVLIVVPITPSHFIMWRPKTCIFWSILFIIFIPTVFIMYIESLYETTSSWLFFRQNYSTLCSSLIQKPFWNSLNRYFNCPPRLGV